jgi:hypothetical protein
MADLKGWTEVETWTAESWVGARIEQVRAEAPEYQKYVGRKGTVDDALVDETGQAHVRTREDGMWCPVRLVSVL